MFLGDLLFLLYINDKIDNLVNKTSLFADDTSVFIEVYNNQNVAAMSPTSDLDEIYTWASTWGVHFNLVKHVI